MPAAVIAALAISSSLGSSFSWAWRTRKLPNCCTAYVPIPTKAPPTGVKNGVAAAPAAKGPAICGALCKICSTIYLGASAAAAMKPFSLAMRWKSVTVIPGFVSPVCCCSCSALIAAIFLRISSSVPVAAVPARPKPEATSPKDSMPRLAAAGIASKNPTSSGAF